MNEAQPASFRLKRSAGPGELYLRSPAAAAAPPLPRGLLRPSRGCTSLSLAARTRPHPGNLPGAPIQRLPPPGSPDAACGLVRATANAWMLAPSSPSPAGRGVGERVGAPAWREAPTLTPCPSPGGRGEKTKPRPQSAERRGSAGVCRKQHMDVLRSRVGAGRGTARCGIPPCCRGSVRSQPRQCFKQRCACGVAAGAWQGISRGQRPRPFPAPVTLHYLLLVPRGAEGRLTRPNRHHREPCAGPR